MDGKREAVHDEEGERRTLPWSYLSPTAQGMFNFRPDILETSAFFPAFREFKVYLGGHRIH